MQTKKRAKPVKFGKNKEEKVIKAKAEADINSDEAKEIKHIIEEKTHPKDIEISAVDEKEGANPNITEDEALDEMEKEIEDEPQKIDLSERSEEEKEETMALENTELTSEVEPEELQDKEKSDEEKEEKSSVFGSFTNDAVNRPARKSYMGFYIKVAVITFLVGIGVILIISYFMPEGQNKTTPTPTPVISETSPTAAPTSAPDLSEYSIRVLNGSGTTGEAAKVESLLDEKGFTVASIGNAATSDYTKTVITAKKDVNEAYINELVKLLKTKYSVNSVVEDAPTSQTADIVVTVGSEPAK